MTPWASRPTSSSVTIPRERDAKRVAAKKNKLPGFSNDQKERVFWAKHSVEDFASDLEELDVDIQSARTGQIALRLYKEDLEALRKLAKEKGVGHTTLARSIVEQWLERVREKVRQPPRGLGRQGKGLYLFELVRRRRREKD